MKQTYLIAVIVFLVAGGCRTSPAKKQSKDYMQDGSSVVAEDTTYGAENFPVTMHSRSTIIADTSEFYVEDEPKTPYKVDYLLKVVPALVCNDIAFGYLGEGSSFFNLKDAEKGYQINVIVKGETTYSVYTSQAQLSHYIDLVKYKMQVRDSIINNK